MSYKPEDHSGSGTDTLPDSQSMPIIAIVQSGSAQFKKSHEKYSEKKIEGCEEGDIFLSSENILLPKPLTIIPLRCQETFTLWSDNKLKGIKSVDAAAEDNYKSAKEGNKTLHFFDDVEWTRTDYWFVRYLSGKEYEQGILALKSTSLKLSQRISSTIKRAKEDILYKEKKFLPPIFSVSIELTTVGESKPGQSWFGWDILSSKVLDYNSAGELMGDCATMQSQIKMLEGPAQEEATADGTGDDRPVDDQPY